MNGLQEWADSGGRRGQLCRMAMAGNKSNFQIKKFKNFKYYNKNKILFFHVGVTSPVQEWTIQAQMRCGADHQHVDSNCRALCQGEVVFARHLISQFSMMRI